MAVMTYVVTDYQKKVLIEQIKMRGQNLAHAMATISIDAILSYNLSYLDSFAKGIVNNDRDVIYTVFQDKKGNLISKYGEIKTDNKNTVEISNPIIYEKEKIGSLSIGFSLDGINNVIRKSQFLITIFTSLCVLLLSIIFLVIFKKIIQNPIREVVEIINELVAAGGDLTRRLKVRTRDEIGELGIKFNLFLNNLHDIIGQVAQSSIRVSRASGEIAAGSDQMAAGSEEQKSQTTQVATAVEEMSATIIQVAKNATMAAELSKEASEVAGRGGNIVTQNAARMSEIAKKVGESAQTVSTLGHRSNQIGEIISVIDDIADQTNLLALNAAIEAARAGDQGRGFAVVADEVRKLAERTTKATREIAEMIKAIQNDSLGAVESMADVTKEVEKGVEMAKEASESLTEIINVVAKVMDQVQQIAAAMEEQSTATEQISSNIESVATIAKQAAEGAKEISESIQELNKLALLLQEIVDKFKLIDKETEEKTLISIISKGSEKKKQYDRKIA